MHSILMIGQSNMAGRGFKQDVDPIKNKKLFVLRNGRWRPMYVPINPDRNTAGISLAESFADLYAEEKSVEVGLIPCADGGSSLDMWEEGGVLLDHAIFQANLAKRSSTITAVLWHQGESDCGDEKYSEYEEKLNRIFDALCEKLDLYDVPFLVGGLGDFLEFCPTEPECAKNYQKVNKILEKIANKRENTGFVSAKGLTSNPDFLHFNAVSLREFGRRYYTEFLKLENKDKIFESKGDGILKSTGSMELL
ncbi:MAG: sialate O-acetylesterase [Clostridia bacterium]|nr:sialate O-acetylesterase [Clostridia bacterium]